MSDGQFPYWEYPIGAGFGASAASSTTESSTSPTTGQLPAANQ
jgi:pantoate kinase